MPKISENLSARTLFHFTSELEYLTGILTSNFKPRYSLEDTSFINIPGLQDISLAYPMVCFCDIPLSKIKKHIGTYGNYGIGLEKKWGMKKGLSPILYMHKNAGTSKVIKELITIYRELLIIDEGLSRHLNTEISKILMYSKPYNGRMERQGQRLRLKFYDEREWRWIPRINNPAIPLHLEIEEYTDDNHRERANQIIGEAYPLSFTPDDIKYLIVRNEDEILPLVRAISEIKSIDYDQEQVSKLTTRIITSDQIRFDF